MFTYTEEKVDLKIYGYSILLGLFKYPDIKKHNIVYDYFVSYKNKKIDYLKNELYPIICSNFEDHISKGNRRSSFSKYSYKLEFKFIANEKNLYSLKKEEILICDNLLNDYNLSYTVWLLREGKNPCQIMLKPSDFGIKFKMNKTNGFYIENGNLKIVTLDKNFSNLKYKDINSIIHLNNFSLPDNKVNFVNNLNNIS